MNTYLKYQTPVMQFLSFLGLACGCFLVNLAINTYFFADISAVLLNKNSVIADDMIVRFKVAQFVGAIVSFVLPALLFGYFSSPKALPYVGIQKSVSPLLLMLSVFLLAAIQPFVGWLGNLNAKVNFGSMQATLQSTEEKYNRVLEVFLQMKSAGALMINIIIMALLPALGEELFFRGSLQKALLRLSNRPWLAILISSLIFALLHGTFFKIIPIFTLGIMLGTVYYITRNLWYNVLIHFLNNALAVFAVYYSGKNVVIKKFANDSFNVPLLTALISFVIVIALLYFIKKKSDEVLPAIITNEDNDYTA